MIKDYKGYSAKIGIDEDQNVLQGEILGINDIVTFEATNVEDLVKGFHASVDDYLDFCKERGEVPDKPYSGRIVLRMDPEIHRQLAIKSKQVHSSINDLIVDAVGKALEPKGDAGVERSAPSRKKIDGQPLDLRPRRQSPLHGSEDAVNPYLSGRGLFPAEWPFASGVFTLQRLTDQALQEITELARRYQISTDAAMSMLQAVVNGNGTMAQFNHPELGGAGQWMRGGMTMVGDMFNSGLKSKVDGLCTDLSQLLARQPFTPASQTGSSGSSGSWWPAELGSPNASGGQNNVRYAYFANAKRLALGIDGHVTVYDTLDHQIGGVSQQQSTSGSVTFTSQHGTVDVARLPVVSVDGNAT